MEAASISMCALDLDTSASSSAIEPVYLSNVPCTVDTIMCRIPNPTWLCDGSMSQSDANADADAEARPTLAAKGRKTERREVRMAERFSSRGAATLARFVAAWNADAGPVQRRAPSPPARQLPLARRVSTEVEWLGVALESTRRLVQPAQSRELVVVPELGAIDRPAQHAQRLVVDGEGHREGVAVLPAVRQREARRVAEARRRAVDHLGHLGEREHGAGA